jgi:hypothetical protein
MISDFETGKVTLNVAGGRRGDWYAYNDGTGTQIPAANALVTPDAVKTGACGSTYALETTGTTFTNWGAGVGTGFVPTVGGKKVPYSAANYLGVTFQARASAAMRVHVGIADANTSPDAQKCKRCDDRHGRTISLGTTWQHYVVPFAALMQAGWGDPQAPFDKTQIYAIQFQVAPRSPAFDMWIDDVAFFSALPTPDAAVPPSPDADAGSGQ